MNVSLPYHNFDFCVGFSSHFLVYTNSRTIICFSLGFDGRHLLRKIDLNKEITFLGPWGSQLFDSVCDKLLYHFFYWNIYYPIPILIKVKNLQKYCILRCIVYCRKYCCTILANSGWIVYFVFYFLPFVSSSSCCQVLLWRILFTFWSSNTSKSRI